jgi:hypothetical protein
LNFFSAKNLSQHFPSHPARYHKIYYLCGKIAPQLYEQSFYHSLPLGIASASIGIGGEQPTG